MQSNNEGNIGMFEHEQEFEFDDYDDILSTFDDGHDDLLEALSKHDDNLFDDINVGNEDIGAPNNNVGVANNNSVGAANNNNIGAANMDFDMSAPSHETAPNQQACNYPEGGGSNNINVNNLFRGFVGVPTMGMTAGTAVTVDTFGRRASLGDADRPSKPMRRRGKKKKSGRGNNIMSEEPLFGGGGGMRRQSEGDIMTMMDDYDDDDYSQSDMASACSAPADLTALCGLYDDPTATAKAPPDVLDIHSMLLGRNNIPQQQQQLQPRSVSATNSNNMAKMTHLGGVQDEETMLIRQRQQQLLHEERQLIEAAALTRPRRRKSFDATKSLTGLDAFNMNMMHGSGVNPIYGDVAMNVPSDGNVQIKRRKSEPSMMDFVGTEISGLMNDNSFGYKRQESNQSNLSQSYHSAGHDGFPASFTQTGIGSNVAMNDNICKTALDVAVEEAQDKINHLKKLLFLSRNMKGGNNAGGAFESGQVQQQPNATNSWWTSLSSELGGTGLNLNPNHFGPTQDLAIPTKAQKKKTKKKPKAKPEPAPPAQIPLPDKPDPEILKLDPKEIMEKLKNSMSRTTTSMKKLQEWDRANGLPKSHSQTMVNSNRSRRQLAEGAGHTLEETKKEVESGENVTDAENITDGENVSEMNKSEMNESEMKAS